MRAWDILTFAGVVVFVVGAILWAVGDLAMPWLALLPAAALILVGTGQAGRRRLRGPDDRILQ